jgi:N-acyl homoserine lactone hydrolase
MTSIRRLYVLLCGYEVIPKTISTRDKGGRFILSEPICAYLLDTETGWVLLDAGVNPDNIHDPARAKFHYLDHGITLPIVRPQHEMERQFAEIGIGFSDVKHVILSHLHFDHSGYLRHFSHARFSIQRREYEFAVSGKTSFAYITSDYDAPGMDWHLVDGDWEAQPGLTLLDTRGHTPGHQSAVVELPESGTIVLPFDAGDLQENFDQEILPGESCDDKAALAAIRRLKRIVAETGGRMILFHDPVAIQTTRLAPEFYG